MSAALVVFRNPDDALRLFTPLDDEPLQALVAWLAGGEPSPGSWPPPCGWIGTDGALRALVDDVAADGWSPCLVVFRRGTGGPGVAYDAAAGPWHAFARDLLDGLTPSQPVLQ
jgi:hypothetical protein